MDQGVLAETIPLSKEHLYPLRLGEDPEERIIAQQITWLTVNWGRLEYWLYRILVAIDTDRGPQWTTEFFKTDRWGTKKRKVRDEVLQETTDYPEFSAALDETLADLDQLRFKRNKIAHGLWRRISPGVFEVTPLRLDNTGELDAPLAVDWRELQTVLKAMDSIERRFAMLGADMMAHQWLKKDDRTRI